MSDLAVYLVIDIKEPTNFHYCATLNAECKFEINEEHWSFIVQKIDNTHYHVIANKFNKNKQEFLSKIDKEVEDLTNYDKKIESALKETEENISHLTKDFYTKIATEKDFGSEFIENNQELFGRLAGDIRILEESKKILEKNRSRKNISIKNIVSERFTWTMELGERFTHFGMTFNLCKDIKFPEHDVKQNYEEVEIPILFHESAKKYIKVVSKPNINGSGTLCDILCANGKIMRASVTENNDLYLCAYQDMDNLAYRQRSFIEKIGINEHRVFPVNLETKTSDFKINEKVLALYVQNNGYSNCFLYSGTITKIDDRAISIKFDDGDCCTIHPNYVRKIDGIPENYRVQKGHT
ncbi:MAG: hypothetical protein Dasosvirus1_15 [Dasosvirus sp.]|uniref:Uncharacterized protein n=1 Tax=Dasosvirus sp. TaxID=2487764 RepID=A0A3G4ZR48_9VIRU|nr:MAG: hypothetical protein Dasosvirus1_15 [Dasosvirus sp.]